MEGKTLTLLSSGEYSDYRVTDLLWVPAGVDATKVSTGVYAVHCEVMAEAEYDGSKIRDALCDGVHERFSVMIGEHLRDIRWIDVEEACRATLLAMGCELATYTETWIGSV